MVLWHIQFKCLQFLIDFQVSLDVPWGPNCVYGRCYDYLNLAKTVDFLVIMAYDELSQSGAPYRAGANSPWGNLVAGVIIFG